jgi:hypothetical protein
MHAHTHCSYVALLTNYCAIQIYCLPEFELVFSCRDFVLAPEFLYNDTDRKAPSFLVPHIPVPPSYIFAITPDDHVVEVCLKTLGSNEALPILMARTRQNDLLVYQAFHCDRVLRWMRVKHSVITRNVPFMSQIEQDPATIHLKRFNFFSNATRSGVCMTGIRYASDRRIELLHLSIPPILNCICSYRQCIGRFGFLQSEITPV